MLHRVSTPPPMRPPEFITSPANPLIKELRKAVSRGGLMENGWCVAESANLLEEALRSPCSVRAVIAGESAQTSLDPWQPALAEVRLVTVPDKFLDASSQGLVALVEPPQWTLSQLFGARPLLLVIDRLQDPGNLGTILRSAEAFGATGALLSKGTVNAFNPKVIRASAGSIFRLPFLQGLDDEELLAMVRESGADLYSAVPDSSRSLDSADLTRPCALVIGSEGRGVSAVFRRVAQDLSIPTAGVESLNAAVSAAVLLYEARRQRNLTREARPL